MTSTADQPLLNALQTAIGLLELAPADPLRQDVNAICSHGQNPNFRIAVFAPFNYGKSTLLNALLGERTLPIDLIPTTGAAIVVKYGSALYTKIRLTDGSELSEQGTDLLSRFAILDDNRRMRDDVAAVEVCCPHPFLQLGVEFVDLPGTDDREAQDALVKNQLLTADLVVQVLDARKLMTLQERETLRDWLLDRGIETVLFVVNFLNLLEPDDQKQVLHRLRFVAESFRSQLSSGVSNLYRVDALPALRAQIKGDSSALHRSGLPMLESALQTIAQTQSPDLKQVRLQMMTQQVSQALQNRIEQIQAEIKVGVPPVDSAENQRREIKRKALTLIERGFTQSVSQLRNWLNPSHLLVQYQTDAMAALHCGEFTAWETDRLKRDWLAQKRLVTDWIYKACDFLEIPRPTDPGFSFPDPPTLPNSPSSSSSCNSSSGHPGFDPAQEAPSDAIAAGLRWVLDGSLGAAVLDGANYMLHQITTLSSEDAGQESQDSVRDAKMDAAQLNALYFTAFQGYCDRLSTAALAALSQYETSAQKILSFDLEQTPFPVVNPAQHYQLALLQKTLEQLEMSRPAIQSD
ncbi:MAG TPA: dynamin family protein [Coleofasciculaceae cyanobacterium]|jgi:hypothetical protein